MLEIYRLLGTSKQQLSYWKLNPYSTSTIYKRTKISVIKEAQTLFSISQEKAEALANSAGLTLAQSVSINLPQILRRRQFNHSSIYKNSFLSSRMFFYCLNREHAAKESLIAIAVTLGLTIDEIDKLLRGYGFCLSRSMPADVVLMWRLRHGSASVDSLNAVFYELGLPLLGTREKLDGKIHADR